MDSVRKGFQALEANFKKLDQVASWNVKEKARIAEQSARLAFAISKEMWGQMEQLKQELEQLQEQAGIIDFDKVGGS